jgi:hypothetical protein
MSSEEKGFAFLVPLVVIIVLAVLGMGAFFTYQKSKEFSLQNDNPQNQNQTACTEEAKICPDGVTAVGRSGPNCEFAECPQTNNQTLKTYTNSEYGLEFTYPEKLNSEFFHLQEPMVIKSLKTDKNIKNNCYVGGANPAQKRQDIKINETNFCFSQSYDPGAGSGANYYFYTFLKDNNYFTIQFQINQPNSCGNYIDTPNQEPCQKAFQDYQTLVDKPLQDSINTLKFIEKISKEESCINSGGSVNTVNCYCSGTLDFYNNCAIGGCACTPNPANLKQIKACNCSDGNCFDGSKCVKITNN